MKTLKLPPGFGPVLASSRDIPESQRVQSGISLGVACVAVACLVRLRGLEWPWSFGCGALLFAILYTAHLRGIIRAGEGWLHCCGFVRTDRLIELRARFLVNGSIVRFTDADGRWLDVTLHDLSRDMDIWKLVYAGVVASRERGLVINDDYTAQIFGIPKGKPEHAPALALSPHARE